MKYFGIFIIIAMLCFFLAFMYLPVLLFTPGKFANFFTLGSLFTHLALAFTLANPLEYFRRMLQRKDDTWLGILYVFSVIGTMYAS